MLRKLVPSDARAALALGLFAPGAHAAWAAEHARRRVHDVGEIRPPHDDLLVVRRHRRVRLRLDDLFDRQVPEIQGAVADTTLLHSTKVEIVWTVVPVLILVVMAVPAARTLIAIEDTRNTELTIKVTGYQWKWQYEYIDERHQLLLDARSRDSDAARQLRFRLDPNGRSRTTCSTSTTRWSCRKTPRCACC
jgi:hypothetical protein